MDALHARIAKLEGLIESQVTPRFDDVQDEHKLLAARMNDYQGRVEERVAATAERVTREIYKMPMERAQEAYGRLLDEFKTKLRKIASEEFVRGLTKEVLVTRGAIQNDLKKVCPWWWFDTPRTASGDRSCC